MQSDVLNTPSRDAKIREVKRAADHLAVRIDAALTDPSVDLRRYMALIQEYTRHLCTLKAYYQGQSARVGI